MKGAEHQPAHKSLPEWDHKLKTTWAITFPPRSYFFYILFEHNKSDRTRAECAPHRALAAAPYFLGLVFPHKKQEQRVRRGYRIRD